ncbi:MAG: AI-2E family transporter [Pseudomonadota bacterium]
MGLSTGQQVRYWSIAAVLFVAFLWVMGNTLLPFIVGAAIAYLLDPAADSLERRGFSRVGATAVITALVVVLIALVVGLAVPVIAQQIEAVVTGVPELLADTRDMLTNRFPELFDDTSMVRQALTGMEDTLKSGGVALLKATLSSSLAVIDFLLLVFVAPIVAFYLLLDWDRMIGRIDDLLPREHAPTIRDLATQVDEALSGFVRGQVTVCIILGGFYAVALTLIGLPFGAIIGIFAGLISFVPFVGSILGGAVSIGVALFHFWGDWVWVAAVAGVFVFGQLVEGNVLTPKMVGDRVKLHPVWLIFALSAFGALFGFSGLLIAVPVSASIGVLSRFAIAQYREGRLYKGPATGDEAAGASPRDAAE